MAAALVAFLGLSIINFVAHTLWLIILGTLLQGIPSGMFSTLAITYAADVCPQVVTEYLAACINMCWVVGQVLSLGILWVMANHTKTSYRDFPILFPIGLQWTVPPVLIIACYFAPESPWYLARRGLHDDALVSLKRLSFSSDLAGAEARLDEIRELLKLEENMCVGSTYLDCFRGSNRRRTEIGIMCSTGQLVAGFAIASQVVFFLDLAGFGKQSFKIAFVNSVVLATGGVLYFFIHGRVSFRHIYIYGLAAMVGILLAIGLLEGLSRTAVLRNRRGVLWGQSGLLIFWSLVYGGTLGPVTNAIICDISALTLRPKTLALARTSYDILNLVQAGVGPQMVGPANMRGFTAFLPAGFGAMWLLWSYYRLPHLDGIPIGVLDHLFQARVPARNFHLQATRLKLGLDINTGQDGKLEAPSTQESGQDEA